MTVPDRCYLCREERLKLRFPGRPPPAGHLRQTYACTNFGHGSHPEIWRCLRCGLLFQWPMPAAEDLLRAYRAVEDPLYEEEREGRYVTFRRVVQKLGPGEGRRLLDVGAYCGYFLDVARQAGYRAEGIELSAWAASRAALLGVAVEDESLADRAASGRRYDVVTMWDVVEHLADPRAELASAFRLVSPGGRLYLSTIDAASLVARVMGRRWPWLMDMHLYYFTRHTIAKLLQEAGFEVDGIGLYTHVVSAGYLLRKAGATFPPAAPVFRRLAAVPPPHWRVPVNLGDNMLVSARRRD
jgi:SAM-dependent methyltransferase